MTTTKPVPQQTKNERKVTMPKKKKQPRYVYVGPTLPNHLVQQYAVFIGTRKPDFLKDFIEKYPLIEKLIVPSVDFPKVLKEMKVQGSPTRTIYERFVEQLKGGE